MEDQLISAEPVQKKQVLIWRIVSLILLIFLVTVVVLYACGVGWKKKEEEKEPKKEEGGYYESEITLWNESSPIHTKLFPYIRDIKDENSTNFIPVKERIAVFDLDGTLFCETDPIYFDWNMFAYRVLDDPDYKATEDDKILGREIRAANIHDLPDNIEERHSRRNPAVFANMTMPEYAAYIKKFLDQPSPGYDNLKRGDAFYKPMLEVVSYLQKNDFTVYIVSGTDRFEVRNIVEGKVNIPESQIIGSVSSVKASGQGNKDGLHYQFQKNDTVILGGRFIIKNVKMNKVNTITTEIGKKPVLSFGNSSGDKSMATFVTSDNKYKSLAFQLCCDDEERENGNKTKAEIMRNICKENNWEAISMKNDWKTIYGDNVKRHKQ